MPPKKNGHIHLAKANDDLVSHCRCAEALITFPPQMDCPWCGCGWLFTCITCRKAFTFAKGVFVPEAWEQTAARDIRNQTGNEPEPDDVTAWVGAMKELLSDVRVGEQYVCLDGMIIPVRAHAVRFEGWHSVHDLASVPQVAALRDPTLIESVLGNREYWERTAIEADGE